MLKLEIPIGSKVTQIKKKIVQIRVPNTKFWIIGEQQKNYLWNAYVLDPKTNRKQVFRENMTTKIFAIFSGIILKTPFPYNGKNATNLILVKKHLNQITK
jgi:hypothetical protein